jgi:hypothetical protein
MSLPRRELRVLLIGLVGLLGPAATARGQAIVVTAKSLNELAADVEFLVKSISSEDEPMGQFLLEKLEQFRSGQIVKGLDHGRSIGLAVFLPKDFPQGEPASIAAVVPVIDLGQFLDSLPILGFTVDDQPGVAGFSHRVTGPSGSPTLFVLESKGYAMFSPLRDGADKLKTLDPTSWRRHARSEADLSVEVRLSEFPQSLKDQVHNQMQARAEQQKTRRPGDDDATHIGRIAGQDLAVDAINRLVQDGDALSLDLKLDRKTSQVALDATLTARTGTTLASSLRDFGAKRSRFDGLGRGATLAAWARVPLAKGFQDAMVRIVETGLASGLKEADSPATKNLITRAADLMKSNLNAPEIDLGLALLPAASASPGGVHFVIVGGMSLKEGRAVERLIRDLVAHEKPEKGLKVAFDVAKSADGTAIHQTTRLSVDSDPDLVKRFGNASLLFAFREDTIMASLGGDSLPSLRRCIDGLSTPPASTPGSEAPVAATANVAGLGDLLEKEEDRKAFQRAAADVLKGEAANRDRISLRLTGDGAGIRLHLAIDLSALTLLNKLYDLYYPTKVQK